MEIKLDAISFTAAPTKTQMENAVRDVRVFFNRSVGAMLAEGYNSTDETFIAHLLNLTVQLKQVLDVMQGQANLAVPGGGGPQAVRR